MRVSDLCKFIVARERHRAVKIGLIKGHRPDPIIAKYRFCNVRRNDDRVTEWVLTKIMEPNRHDPNLWFALTVARLFNNEPTLASIMPYILPFKPKKMRDILHRRAEAGEKNFNAAYIVSTNGRSMDKVDYVLDLVLQPMWDNRKKIAQRMAVGQLANAHTVLMDQQGLGSFMAAQVLADLKYAVPTSWDDFYTFAASGPGSRRGLNRVMGLPIKEPMSEGHFRSTLSGLRDSVNLKLNIDPLTAQDLQNCLCEFDKYERARTGEGRPKQMYKPVSKPWKED